MVKITEQSSASAQLGAQSCLSHTETERLIQGLTPFNVEDVGTAEYLAQHKALNKLNLQAHANAQSHSEEYVTDLLVGHDKATLLVRELLVIEAWKAQLLPRLRSHLADEVPGLVTYFILYQEGVLANLLELLLYHQTVAGAISEDALLELVDWAGRQLAALAAGRAGADVATHAALTSEQMLALTPAQELDARAAEVAWQVGLAGLTISRYLIEHAARLPLGVAARLLRANDFVLALVPLLEAPPWVRAAGGKVNKYVEGAWRVVPPADRHLVTQHDVQAWLALTNLVCDPEVASRYELGAQRAEALMRLRPQLHDLLLDQLPVLRMLATALDGLVLGAGAPGAGAQGAGASSWLVLEQVPELRAALTAGRDWDALAGQQRRRQFGPSGLTASRRAVLDMAEVFDLMCDLSPEAGGATNTSTSNGINAGSSSSGGADIRRVADQAITTSSSRVSSLEELLQQPIRVDCSRKVQAGLWEHWGSFSAAIDAQVEATSVSVRAAPSNKQGTSSSSSSSSKGGSQQASSSVSGERYKLQPLSVHDKDGKELVLPPEGKVVVRLGPLRAEALLALPAPSSAACIEEAPRSLWLTVGLLAADKLVLQLRLTASDTGRRRDKAAGCWAVYTPTGGAVTLADGVVAPADSN